MALIDLRLKPSRRELRWFGLLLLLFFGLVGGLVLWRLEARQAALTLWSIGAVLAVVYYAVPPLRVPLYRGWLLAVYPIGWLVSHLALGTMYYGVLTPIGLLMRLFGHDPMKRRFEPEEPTYWTAYDPARDPGRYFRQF